MDNLVFQRCADCRAALAEYEDNSIDAIVTDPPAGISFMGKEWDTGKGFIAFLTEVFTLAYAKMKPGAHGLIWALPRTSHWTATALEAAGFEIRDEVTHIFGSGFPKNYDAAKGVEAKLTTGSANWNGFRNLPGQVIKNGGEGASGLVKINADQGNRPREYESGKRVELEPTTELAARYNGFGTALKPAKENWILIRKPSKGSVAASIIKFGTGAVNIELARPASGRWPTNILFSHDLECGPLECSPGCPVAELDAQSESVSRFFPTFEYDEPDRLAIFGYFAKPAKKEKNAGLDDLAAQAKIFNGQSAAASKSVEPGSVEAKFSTAPAKNHHPTVKSTALMKWLINLITPPAPPIPAELPLVVDLFAGSGSGGVAAVQLKNIRWHGYDNFEPYCEIAQRRIDFARLPPEIQNRKRGQYYIDWSLFSAD